MRYKVATRGGGWRYGFRTLESATWYAIGIYRRTGVVAAVEAYRGRL